VQTAFESDVLQIFIFLKVENDKQAVVNQGFEERTIVKRVVEKEASKVQEKLIVKPVTKLQTKPKKLKKLNQGVIHQTQPEEISNQITEGDTIHVEERKRVLLKLLIDVILLALGEFFFLQLS
jgi:5,10-methenyltetrahydromethanopterin hydrogenase